MSEATTIAGVCSAWWEGVAQRPGDRARLRRATTVADALMVPSTHRLLDQLRPLGWTNPRRIALLAVLLADAKRCDLGGDTTPERLGKPAGDRAVFAESRFRRLLRASEEEDLLLQLRRAVRMLGGEVHLPSLAEAVRYWTFDADKHAKTMIRWACDYFAKAPSTVNS